MIKSDIKKNIYKSYKSQKKDNTVVVGKNLPHFMMVFLLILYKIPSGKMLQKNRYGGIPTSNL
jgi:hypothetical protein